MNRPDARGTGLKDLLFEFKYLKPTARGEASGHLELLTREELAELPAVRVALEEADDQARRYRDGLHKRFGKELLRVRAWTVVVLGFERLVARAVS